jgi:hypothetical protein
MDDAPKLTPEAMALTSGHSAAKTLSPKPEPTPLSEKSETKSDQRRKPAPSRRPSKRKREGNPPKIGQTPPPSSDGSFVGQLLVTVTNRLQPKNAEMLRRACLEQKLAGRRPHTQQEIIERATQSWLKERGYLKSVSLKPAGSEVHLGAFIAARRRKPVNKCPLKTCWSVTAHYYNHARATDTSRC